MSTISNTHDTREGWLNQAVVLLRPLIEAQGHDMPARVLVSVGFPKYGASGAIGQCWDGSQSMGDEKVPHLFISPDQTDPLRVLDILLHELVHATVGCECGHRGPFKTLATALGLAGKMTATYAEVGTELHAALEAMVEKLGPYPHVGLKRPVRVTKARKWVRMMAVSNEEYTVVVSPASLETYGPPTDPWGDEMVPVKGRG